MYLKTFKSSKIFGVFSLKWKTVLSIVPDKIKKPKKKKKNYQNKIRKCKM